MKSEEGRVKSEVSGGMKFRYRTDDEMKDSGVEWLGRIPREWSVKKLKYLANIDTGNKDTQDKEDDGLYPFFVRSDTVERSNTYSFDGEAILTAGDGVGVAKVFHYINDKFAYHQRVYKVSDFKEIKGKYLYYYIKDNLGKEVEKISAKTTVDSLRLPMFLNFPVLINEDGGEKIGKFLDEKTYEFDSIISKKEALIQKLEEAKKSLISEVVTGKVKVVKTSDGYELVERKKEEMKDSGVEWIEYIPSEWNIVLYKRIIRNIKDGTHGTHERVENGEYLLSAKNINNNSIEVSESDSKISHEEYKKIVSNGFPEKNDILISTVGTIGRSYVYEMSKPLAFQRSVTFIRLKENNNPYFYKYFMDSDEYQKQLNSFAKTSAQSGVYMGDILKTLILKLSINDQNNIVQYLNKELLKLNYVIDRTKKQIEKLKEAKQSLISEAVTGKIEVLD